MPDILGPSRERRGATCGQRKSRNRKILGQAFWELGRAEMPRPGFLRPDQHSPNCPCGDRPSERGRRKDHPQELLPGWIEFNWKLNHILVEMSGMEAVETRSSACLLMNTRRTRGRHLHPPRFSHCCHEFVPSLGLSLQRCVLVYGNRESQV
jgi:hypothetical protein